MKELRVFGPPGTGKSTWLATEAIPKAVDRYGANKIVVTSFTRTAAFEIASKPSLKTGEPIRLPQENIGTLHALCFRLLSQPKLIYKELSKWNETHQIYRIGSISADMDEGGLVSGMGVEDGSRLIMETDKLRNKVIPTAQWNKEQVDFYNAWSDFKYANNAMDFLDLIETGIRDLVYGPNQPQMIFVDEAQDFTRLQLKLIRQWGLQAEWVVLVGDDDQTLYEFTGATPDAFLNPPIEEKNKRVLSQSFRVPINVHARATKLIETVSRREPKAYKPTIVDGHVYQDEVEPDTTFELPDALLHDVPKLEGLLSRIKRGQTIMYLASCSYMLQPMISLLRSEGILYHNPYRRTRGDWNPLRQSTKNSVSIKDVLLAYLSVSETDSPHWHVGEFVKWATFIKCSDDGMVKKHGRAGIKALVEAIENDVPGLETTRNVAGQILKETGLNRALARDLDWLQENLVRLKQKAIAYPMTIVREHGENAIRNHPQVIVGTIHSVKGGEADAVYLVPDISRKSASENENRDSIIRMFYVGMTRTREDLIILRPATSYYEDLNP